MSPSALRGGQRGTVGHDLVLDVHLARVVEHAEEAFHGGRGRGKLLDAGQVVRLVVVNALEVLLSNGRLLLWPLWAHLLDDGVLGHHGHALHDAHVDGLPRQVGGHLIDKDNIIFNYMTKKLCGLYSRLRAD